MLDEEVAGELTKSYQYSPWGQRLSQIKHNADGTTEDGYYGYNSHTDVETLTDENGDTKATYGYTAYGNRRRRASSPASTSPTPATRPRSRTTPTGSTPSAGTPAPARTTWASATTTRA